MDHTACHVLFCDRRAECETLIRRNVDTTEADLDAHIAALAAPQEVKDNVKVILAAFQEVFLCRSGMACSVRLRELEVRRHQGVPVVVFLDIDPKVDFGNRLSREAPLQRSAFGNTADEGLQEYYGVTLLKHLAAEALQDGIGKLVIPIAVIRDGKRLSAQSLSGDFSVANLCDSLKANVQASTTFQLVDPPLLMKCLDAGATDAFNAPLTADRLQQIIVAAYKAHLTHAKTKPDRLDLKRIRKRSWVGVEEERPYAYLRESMVSSLMNSICRPETASLGLESNPDVFDISRESGLKVARAIGSWEFSAHDFSDDELLHGAFLMLTHCLGCTGLEKWRIPDRSLRSFLLSSRAAYNSFVPYHNFRHVVDVLQALFYSLLQIGALPSYSSKSQVTPRLPSSAISKLLGPLDALVLLVSAIGHDVGHPGVSNAFLVTLKAPLAQLYNDKSVLEAFHCAAYSQILRRHWKSIYEDVDFRRRLINTILATDMGIHPEYMANLGNLQEKLHHDGGTDSWSPKLVQTNRDLVLGLLIKCADISNVARPFRIAAHWAEILQQEFARQGEMERDVGMSSTLFGGPPELGNITKLANSQIGFMNFFGLPLFEGVADILPDLQFAVDEIVRNKAVWEEKIEQEKRKEEMRAERSRYKVEGTQSPRSASPNRTHFTVSPELSHPEGLPASGLSPEGPIAPKEPAARDSPALHRLSLLDGNEVFFTPPVSPGATMESRPLVPDARVQLPQVAHRDSGAYPITDESSKVSLKSGGNGNNGSLPNPTAYVSDRHPSEPQTGSEKSGPTTSSRSGSQNFSRPYSHQHSAQPSCAPTRSSASRAPTFSSTNYPNSPSETHATSVGDHSDLGSPALPPDALDRPTTGHSETGFVDMGSDVPSRTSRASVSVISETPAEKAQPRVRPVTSGAGTRGYRPSQVKDKDMPAQIKRKPSRWKFDFWRRRKHAERDAQSVQPPHMTTADTP